MNDPGVQVCRPFEAAIVLKNAFLQIVLWLGIIPSLISALVVCGDLTKTHSPSGNCWSKPWNQIASLLEWSLEVKYLRCFISPTSLSQATTWLAWVVWVLGSRAPGILKQTLDIAWLSWLTTDYTITNYLHFAFNACLLFAFPIGSHFVLQEITAEGFDSFILSLTIGYCEMALQIGGWWPIANLWGRFRRKRRLDVVLDVGMPLQERSGRFPAWNES
jgi:hypothetical protein